MKVWSLRVAFAVIWCAAGPTHGHPQDSPAPTAHALAPVGPLGYWKGDEGETPSAAEDATGNGRKGTYSAGAKGCTIVPPTKFPNPGSFGLDGASGMISVPDSPALRMAGDFTLAFWKRRTAPTNDWVRLVGKGNPAQRNFGLWEFPGGDGRLKFQMYNAQGGSILEVDLPPEQATKQDTWYHVVCTLSVNAAGLYLNGIPAATGYRNGEPGIAPDPLTFGHAGFHGFFAGQLDDVRIYDRALSMSEIVYLAQGHGSPAAPTDLSASGVTLRWTASTTPPPAGTATHYVVKRSASSGSGYSALSSARMATTYTDTTAEAGKTYFYVVTAVNTGGESVPSSEVKVVLPPK